MPGRGGRGLGIGSSDEDLKKFNKSMGTTLTFSILQDLSLEDVSQIEENDPLYEKLKKKFDNKYYGSRLSTREKFITFMIFVYAYNYFKKKGNPKTLLQILDFYNENKNNKAIYNQVQKASTKIKTVPSGVPH